MSSSADYLVDRRRLRSKLTFWRVAAILAAALAVIALAARWGSWVSSARPHIARLQISGLITGDDKTVKLLEDIRASNAAALVLRVDSPGGTTAGSEVLYDEIRRVAEKKPVVAVVGTTAASGAYIVSLAADRIFAHGNSIVGSIGVLVQFPNVSGLMDKVGVKYETIKSSPLKAAPNFFEPTDAAARDAMASVVMDSFAWFKGLVRERRGLSDDELAKVADGRVFNARQGLPLKLVDAIGGEREAISWLEKEKGVAKGLPVRDWKPDSTFAGFKLTSAAAAVLDVLGAPEFADGLRRLADDDRTSVDGLLSVWQLSTGS